MTHDREAMLTDSQDFTPKWFMALDVDRRQVWFFQPEGVPDGHHKKYRCQMCAQRFEWHRPRCRSWGKAMVYLGLTEVPQRPTWPHPTENEIRECS